MNEYQWLFSQDDDILCLDIVKHHTDEDGS